MAFVIRIGGMFFEEMTQTGPKWTRHLYRAVKYTEFDDAQRVVDTYGFMDARIMAHVPPKGILE